MKIKFTVKGPQELKVGEKVKLHRKENIGWETTYSGKWIDAANIGSNATYEVKQVNTDPDSPHYPAVCVGNSIWVHPDHFIIADK